MDPYTQALLDLNGEVGELRGEMKGIGGQLKDIKDLLKCKSEDCIACRREIDNQAAADVQLVNARIDKQNEKLKILEDQHTGEKAVTSWYDSTVGRLAAILGITVGTITVVTGTITLITWAWSLVLKVL